MAEKRDLSSSSISAFGLKGIVHLCAADSYLFNWDHAYDVFGEGVLWDMEVFIKHITYVLPSLWRTCLAA